jgi:hypothetical protein
MHIELHDGGLRHDVPRTQSAAEARDCMRYGRNGAITELVVPVYWKQYFRI